MYDTCLGRLSSHEAEQTAIKKQEESNRKTTTKSCLPMCFDLRSSLLNNSTQTYALQEYHDSGEESKQQRLEYSFVINKQTNKLLSLSLLPTGANP
jgi:hypothetical protein